MIQGGSDSRDRAEGEHSQRLDRRAAAISEDASCVGQWHVNLLCAEAGPGVTAIEAVKALEHWGVRVAELPRLPARPPSAMAPHPDYADLLKKLGRKLSIELVFGDDIKDGFGVLEGIRLEDGRRLDREAIEAARQRVPTGVHHEDWNRILSILADAARDTGALDDIVVWEIAEVLRPLGRLGSSQRAITEQAVRLSLKRSQAEVLAAAVTEEQEMLKPRPAAEPRIKPTGTAADRSPCRDLRSEPDLPAAGLASPEVLQPVTDLRVRAMRGRSDVVQLSWSPPPAGVVSLRMAGEPAPWSSGAIIACADANSYGRPLNVAGVPGPDRRMSCELTLPQARTFVTAITVGTADAAVGRTVEITRGAPVRGLSALRFGDEVRLTWIWPDDATAAYVAWQPSAAEGQHGPAAARQQRRCSRRAFEAEGGFAAVMGHAAQRIEVWAVITAEGEEHVTVPAEIEVPAIGTPVHYDLRVVPDLLNGLFSLVRGRRRRELRLSAELPCVLPDLIVVECRHPAMPLAPHPGDEIVARIAGRPMDPSTPVRTVVELGQHRPSWVACFVDPAKVDPAKSAAGRGRVTLFGPPVGRQRVR
jgi:hypothetical protein